MPRAFITGITGQDGQHLAEFLHAKGYEVFGMLKGQNNPRALQIRDEFPYVELVPGDLADLTSLVSALEYVKPDEVYNLGAISFVAISFGQAELTSNITGLGVLRMLEAIRMVGGTQNNVRPRHHRELSRELRHLCMFRNFVQPRGSTSWLGICYSQNLKHCRPYQVGC